MTFLKRSKLSILLDDWNQVLTDLEKKHMDINSSFNSNLYDLKVFFLITNTYLLI